MNEHVKQFVEFWKSDNGHSTDDALTLYKAYLAIEADLEVKRQKLLKYIVPVKTPRGMWICGFEPSQTNAVACLAADIEMSRKTLESIVDDIEELVLLAGGPVLKMLEDQLVDEIKGLEALEYHTNAILQGASQRYPELGPIKVLDLPVIAESQLKLDEIKGIVQPKIAELQTRLKKAMDIIERWKN